MLTPELARSQQMVLRGERLMEKLKKIPQLVTTNGVGPFHMFADELDHKVYDDGAAHYYLVEHPPEAMSCEAHSLRQPEPACFAVSLNVTIADGDAIPVDIGGGRTDSLIGSLQLERMLWLCMDCALWRFNVHIRERFDKIEASLWTAPELRICNHVATEQASAAWVCGATDCSWSELFCEPCAVAHSFAQHARRDANPSGGCAVCGENVYVPTLMPMTRLWAREAVVSDTAQRAWFNGYVYALNVESTLCRRHLAPEDE
jgi:hypothetical protein